MNICTHFCYVYVYGEAYEMHMLRFSFIYLQGVYKGSSSSAPLATYGIIICSAICHMLSNTSLMWFFFLNIYLFIYLILVTLGLRCCTWAFSSCGDWGLVFVVVHGLLIAVASHCGSQALGAWASIVVAYGLSSCGSWALEHRLSSCGALA